MNVNDSGFAAGGPDLETTRAEVLGRVAEILPLLEREAETAERNGNLSAQSFAALVDSGALRLFAPRRAGGFEAGYRTYVETTLMLARACGSSAWFSFIINHGDWQTGHMSAAVQSAVWADGATAKVGVLLAPSPGWSAADADGGTVLNGEWAYASGSAFVKWVLVACPLLGDDGVPVDSTLGLVSTEGLDIRDTWQVTGMAGTGSNTFVLRDVFVPDECTITMSDLLAHRFRTPHREEALYHMDVGTIFHVSTLVPVLGLAQAALDLTLERIKTRPKPMTYSYYADTTKSPATQFAMSRASWLIQTAVEQERATADAIDRQALTGRPFPALDRARFAMCAAQGHRMCREAMDLLLDVQGAGSFALANPMQRLWRDMHMGSRHGMSVPGLKQEVYGRALLGAEEQHMTPMV